MLVAVLSRPSSHLQLIRAVVAGVVSHEAAKADGAPKLGYGETSPAGERWITVHPHGDDQPGVPVLVRTDPKNPSVARIIGGAGGKLNHTKIQLASPEEWKRRASERRARRKQEAVEAKRRGEPTPASRQREAKEARRKQREETEDAVLRDAAEHLGWDERALTPDPESLRGLEPKAAEKVRREHRQRLLREFRRAAESAKDLLIHSAEARAAGGVEHVPLVGTEDQLGAEDFFGERDLRAAAGYAAESGQMSEETRQAEKRRLLDRRLRDELEHGVPTEAALIARRVSRARAIDEAEVAEGGSLDEPAALVGLAQVAARRLDRRLAAIDADPDSAGARSLDADEAERIRDVFEQVRRGDNDAINSATNRATREELREALGVAARAGLLDPERAREDALAIHEGRFKRAGTVTPEALDSGAVDELDADALDLHVQEAARRARSNAHVAPDLREDAARAERSTSDSRDDGGDDPRQTRIEDPIDAARRKDELRTDALAAGEMDAATKREFLRRALDAGLIGHGGDDTPDAESADEARDARDIRIDDPRAAVKLRLLHRRLRDARRTDERERDDEAEARGPARERADTGGFFDIDHDDARAVVQEIEDAVRTRRARSFLDNVDSAYDDVAANAHLTPAESRQDLTRHLSAGASDALNEHAQTILNGPALDRQAVDLLGAAGAAQVLAWSVHQDRPQEARAIAAALGDHHQREQTRLADEASARAAEAYERAQEVHEGMRAEESGDLRAWHAMNQQRIEHLDAARRHLGEALGVLEATASLHLAVARGPQREVRTSMGEADPTAVAGQAQAVGLAPDDYEVSTDGANTFLTVRESGFRKLVRPRDAKAAALERDLEAIKRGDHDEADWLPAGFARRSDPGTYDGPAAENHAEDFDAGLTQHRTMRDALVSYIGSRVNDGWSPDQIHADLLSDRHRQAIAAAHAGEPSADHPRVKEWEAEHPEPQRLAADLFGGESETEDWRRWSRERADVVASTGANQDAANERHREFESALEDLLPSRHEDADARQRSARYTPLLHQIAQEYNQTRRGGDTTGAIHHQELDNGHARDATFRALARHPAAVAAFKAPGELSHDERTALRHAFHRLHARRDVDEVPTAAARAKEWAPENPEPRRTAPDLFGGESETEEWRAWKSDRDAARQRFAAERRAYEEATEPPSWGEYTMTHGSSDAAYRAVQDLVKGRFLADLRGHYQALAGQPIKAGTTPIDGFDRHLQALDPEWRAAVRSGRAKAQATEQKRTGAGGRFGAGEVRERTEKRLEDEAAARERQVSAFDGGERRRPGGDGTPDVHERVTLGKRAESQIAELVAEHAPMIDPRRPFAARTGVNMAKTADGRDGTVRQQRAVKAWLRAKRIGMFLGTGSGKTNVAFGAFGEARAKGQAERGLFAVPSVVQAQFGSEALGFLEPGKTRWFAKPGASKSERLAAYADPSHHMVVVTHQAVRDDVTDMLAEHSKLPREAVVARLTGFGADGEPVEAWSREETDRRVRAALEHHGAHGLLDFLAVDEGHTALNRAGKRDSHMARVLDSLSRLSKHAGWMTGTPVKNDTSEIYDQLAKVAPDRYHDGDGGIGRAEFLRRYANDSAAGRAALQRELARHTFVGQVDPGTRPNFHDDVVPASEIQRARFEQIDRAYEAARRAHRRGDVDVEALRQIAPGVFKGHPEENHQAVARRAAEALGTLREAAYNHAAHIHEASAKIDHVAKLAKNYTAQGRAGVVFARNLHAVEQLRRRLEADGHSVVTITGKDSADAKRDKAARFQREDHPERADVAVLSDAGATGLNLQGRGSWLVHYDMPHTHATWQQRTARVNRYGQSFAEPDIHTPVLDHPWDRGNAERLERKRALHETAMTDLAAEHDEHGLAALINHHVRHARRRVGATEAA